MGPKKIKHQFMVALNPFNGGSVSRDLKLDGANYDGLLELEMLQIFCHNQKTGVCKMNG